jgi:hypothetical protein
MAVTVTVDVIVIPVTARMAIMMFAVIAPRDRIARESARHAADHRPRKAVARKAAYRRAACGAQRAARVMGMAAASIRQSRACTQRKNRGCRDFGKVFHDYLLLPVRPGRPVMAGRETWRRFNGS